MYARDKGKKDRNETGILTSRREERAGIGIAIERTHKKMWKECGRRAEADRDTKVYRRLTTEF